MIIKKLLLASGIALALTACEPQPQVSQEAMQKLAGKSVEELMPAVSSKTLISTVQGICEKHVFNMKNAPATLRANGYIAASVQKGNTLYVHPSGQRPIVSLAGDRASNPEFCIVLVPDSNAIRRGAAKYVSSIPGAVEFPIAGKIPGALQAWITGRGIFITVTDDGPAGRIFGLGVGAP